MCVSTFLYLSVFVSTLSQLSFRDFPYIFCLINLSCQSSFNYSDFIYCYFHYELSSLFIRFDSPVTPLYISLSISLRFCGNVYSLSCCITFFCHYTLPYFIILSQSGVVIFICQSLFRCLVPYHSMNFFQCMFHFLTLLFSIYMYIVDLTCTPIRPYLYTLYISPFIIPPICLSVYMLV